TFLWLARATAGGQAAIIQGTVCEIRSCAPIPGARLFLISTDAMNGSGRTAVTDIAGKFRFPPIQPGKYPMNVDADNYTAASILPIVTVTEGANIPDLKIELRALGTISGRAFDINGEPLADVRVDALVVSLHVLTSIASTDTDDRGEFRISGLE